MIPIANRVKNHVIVNNISIHISKYIKKKNQKFKKFNKNFIIPNGEMKSFEIIHCDYRKYKCILYMLTTKYASIFKNMQ